MATTLGLSVGITADVGGLVAGAKLAQKEIQQMNKILESARTPAGDFGRSVDLINKALDVGAINIQQHQVLLQSLEAQYYKVAGASKVMVAAEYDKAQAMFASKQAFEATQVAMLKQVAFEERMQQQSTARMARQLGRQESLDPVLGRGGNMLMGMAKPGPMLLLAAAMKSVSSAMNMDTQIADLEALTQNAERAREIFVELRDAASRSPLATEDYVAAVRTMKQYNVETELSVEMSKRLAAIAGTDGEKMVRLARAFGQVQGQGRLLAQERNQMIEAGFNPLQELEKMTGKSMPELTKLMEQGAISADMVTEAFKNATKAGSMFGDRTERLGNSLAGKFNQMTDSAERMFASLGKLASPLLVQVFDNLTWGANNLSRAMEFVVAVGQDVAAMFETDLSKRDFGFKNTDKFLNSLSAAGVEAEKLAGGTAKFAANTKAASEAAKALKEQYAATMAAEAASNSVRSSALQPLLDQIAELRGEGQQTRMLQIANDVFEAEKQRVEALKSAGMEYAKIEANAWKVAEATAAEAKAYEDTIENLKKQNELLERGKQLREQFADPAEKIRKQIQDVQTLLGVGAIDARTGARSILESINQNQSNNTIQGTAGSFTAGSMEASKLLLQRMGDREKRQYDEQKKVTALMEALNITQQQALAYLQKLGTVGVIE